MFPFRSLTWSVRLWDATRNGQIDGLRMIPDQAATEPAAYLYYIRDWGEGRARRLAVHWQYRDFWLHPTYRRRAVLYAQACDAQERAQEHEECTRLRFREKPTQAARKAWQRAQRLLAGGRRRAEKARQRLEAIIARRSARYAQVQSKFAVIVADAEKLMQAYSTANVRAREGHDLPTGLRGEARPQLPCPAVLEALCWDPPLAEALEGLARRRR